MRGGRDGDAPRYRDAPGSTDGRYGPAGYQQVRPDHGQDPARYGREAADYGREAAHYGGTAADYGGTAAAPDGYANVPARPAVPGPADLPGSAYGPGGAYVPGRAYGAGGAYAPGGPGYEFGYQPVPEPVEPYSAGPATAPRPDVAATPRPDFTTRPRPDYDGDFGSDALAADETIVAGRAGRAPVAPDEAAPGFKLGYAPDEATPGYEFGYAPDASPPEQENLLALPPGGEPGRRARKQERHEPVGAGRGWLRDLVSPRPAAGGTAEHGQALPPPLSAAGIKRWAVRVALPMISMVAVGVAVVATFGGGSGGAGPAPATLSVGFPPATAACVFGTTPGDEARGISQSLTRVASSGSQVVAVGSQAGARISRAQFFVSANGGQTWRLGTEQATDGGDPAPGHAATLIAGGQGRWAAVGPSAIWTSHDGVAWTLASTQGITPMQGGDQVNVLRRTATGFSPPGERAVGRPGGGDPRRLDVRQRPDLAALRCGSASPDGRRPPGRCPHLRGRGRGGHRHLRRRHDERRAGRRRPQRLRTMAKHHGGATWSAVTVPVSNGATASAAVAATANGFVAVRPGRAKAGADAVVFTSPDGAAWKFGATVTGQGGAGLTLTSVEGERRAR